jgi:uncharacterized lipoprotein YmbA
VRLRSPCAAGVHRYIHGRCVPAPPSAPGVWFSRERKVALTLFTVCLSAYLFDTSLAVRQGTNEIAYHRSVLWAERLDNGLQRVLAANLASLLPTDQIRLSSWRSEDVSAEFYVSIQQFDVDASGHCVLVGWWRILSPGGEKILKVGEARLARTGPPPDADPAGAVATLSELAGDLSRQLAQTVQAVAQGPGSAPATR